MENQKVISKPIIDDAEEPYPSYAAGWWALTVFTLALVLSYIDRQILTLLVDPVRNELGISDTEISLLIGAAFAVLYAIAGLPFGRAADLYSRRRLIIWGILGWSAATFVSGLAANYGQLFAARVAVGIGEAALLPAAISILADYFSPARRGLALGILVLGAAAGNAVAMMLGSFLLQVIASGYFAWLPGTAGLTDWRLAFMLTSLLGIPVVLLVLTVPEPKRRGVMGKVRPSMTIVRAAFRERAHLLVPIYAALAFMGIASHSLISWLPVLFDRKFGISPAEIGGQLGMAMLAGGMLGAVLGGWLGDLATRRFALAGRLSVVAGVATLALLGSLAGFANSPEKALILSAFMICGTAGSMSIASAAVQDIANSSIRGVAGSMVSMMGTLVGLGLGPTLVAQITDRVYGDPALIGNSMTIVAFSAVACSIVMTLLAIGAVRRKPLAPARKAVAAAS